MLRQEGLGLGLIRKLYAGVAGAALCSILVGAVHFASYETAHRALLERSSATPQDRQTANIAAAVLAASVTAVVESPVELFRHNQQAGLIKGDFLREMVTVVRRDGLAG